MLPIHSVFSFANSGISRNQITPDRSGLGAPIGKDEISMRRIAEREEQQGEAEEAARPKPPVPYRADTTGLSTSHLPPPPGRKDGADGRSPVISHPVSATKGKPPSLPPRLPPRQNSTPISPPPRYTSTEPDTHKGIMNHGALERLGAAGVTVPGFGIEGRKAPMPPPSSNSPTRSPTTQTNVSPQLNELQTRFSRLNSSPSKEGGPSQGTTFAQKQAAFKTASAFRDDPSSVSLSDAKVAASTANNFKERHGDQVKSGWQSANKLNTKYGISEKVGSHGDLSSPQTSDTGSPGAGVLGKKKAPPPPMKKASLGAGVSVPPPIPLSTKPKPGVHYQ